MYKSLMPNQNMHVESMIINNYNQLCERAIAHAAAKAMRQLLKRKHSRAPAQVQVTIS